MASNGQQLPEASNVDAWRDMFRASWETNVVVSIDGARCSQCRLSCCQAEFWDVHSPAVCEAAVARGSPSEECHFPLQWSQFIANQLAQEADWRKHLPKTVKSEVVPVIPSSPTDPSMTIFKAIELLDQIHSLLDRPGNDGCSDFHHVQSDKLKSGCRNVYAGLCGSANEMRYCKSCKKDRLISEFKLKPGSIEHGATCERCLKKKKHAYHDERQKAASVVMIGSPDTKVSAKVVALHQIGGSNPTMYEAPSSKTVLAIRAASTQLDGKTKTKIRRTTQQPSPHLPALVRIELVVASPAGSRGASGSTEIKKQLHIGAEKHSSSINSLFARFQISSEVVFQVSEVCKSYRKPEIFCTKARTDSESHCSKTCRNQDEMGLPLPDKESPICNNSGCLKLKRKMFDYCCNTCKQQHMDEHANMLCGLVQRQSSND